MIQRLRGSDTGSMLKYWLAGFILVCGLFSVNHSFSDPPSFPPVDHLVCSKNGIHCAYITEECSAKIFSVKDKNYPSRPLYTIPKWGESHFISDDGQTFVAVRSALVLDRNPDKLMVWVWREDRPHREYFLSEIMSPQQLQKTASHYVWGAPLGFDGNNVFLLKLNDDSIIKLDL